MEALSQIVADNVRFYRNRLKFTQADLAAATGIHRPNISRLERGTLDFRLSTLSRIAEGLQVPVKALLDESRIAYILLPEESETVGEQ